CTSNADSSVLATCTVTVSAPVAVTGVEVSPSTASINVGGTTTLTATISPSNATNKAVTWESSDDNIASVNSSGVVSGVATGDATITATTSDGGYTDTSAISVSRVSGGTISITISSYSLTGSYAWHTWSSNGVTGQAYIYGGTTSKMQFNSTKSQYYLFNTDAVPGPIETITVKTSDSTKSWTLLTNSSPYTNIASPAPSNGNNRGAKSCDVDGSTSWSISGSDQYFSLNYSDSGVAYISEITIAYGATALSPEEEAGEYAVSFLSATDSCEANASGAWATQKTAFQTLSSNAKAILVNATYVASNYASNTSVQKCAQRYDLAVAKQSLENFMGRASLSSIGLLFDDISQNTSSTIFTIILSTILLSNGVLIMFVFKKKRI
ncbi:MAG: Ig-like domain-containing protein, partial [Bacilli bacterium]